MSSLLAAGVFGVMIVAGLIGRSGDAEPIVSQGRDDPADPCTVPCIVFGDCIIVHEITSRRQDACKVRMGGIHTRVDHGDCHWDAGAVRLNQVPGSGEVHAGAARPLPGKVLRPPGSL